jgi:hypothetical protein
MRNIDATDFYSNFVVTSALVLIPNNAFCLPDDELVQNLYFENLSHAIQNDEFEIKFHAFALLLLTPHYRPINCVLNEFTYTNIDKTPGGPSLAIWGTSIDNLLFTNLLVDNCNSPGTWFSISFLGEVIFENITIINIEDNPAQMISISLNAHVDIRGLKIENYKSPEFASTSVVTISGLEAQTIKIDSVTVTNCVMYDIPLISTLSAYDSITFDNGYFNDVQLGDGVALISFADQSSVNMNNHVLQNVRPIDSNDESSVLIEIKVYDTTGSDDSLINNISITNSSVSVLKINAMVGESSDAKEFKVNNLTYSDSEIQGKREILTTRGNTNTANIGFVFNNLHFDGLDFVDNGYLFYAAHRLLNTVVIDNSTFSNIKSGRIVIDELSGDDIDLTSTTSFMRTEFSFVVSDLEPLIALQGDLTLHIDECIFSNLTSTHDKGGLLNIVADAKVDITNTDFQYNSGIMASIFNIQLFGGISCTN